MAKKYYAGIGSRKTPSDILFRMGLLASDLYKKKWTLRSGGAIGADQAFELGARNRKEVFTVNSMIPAAAFEIAAEVHPAWDMCKPFARTLHARNVLQILGQNLDAPASFVVCWTPDGCEDHMTRSVTTGGTGQAISVASLMNIPVYNLANVGRLEDVRDEYL